MRLLIVCICLCWAWPLAATAANDSVKVRLLASNLRPYLGESLVLTMEIVRPESLRQSLAPDWPQMIDLAVEASLPSVARRLAGDGDPRIVENLRRVVRPLRTGPIVLEDAAVSIGSQRRNAAPFGITARPLPATGRPENFSGAIGPIEAQLDMTGSGRRKVSLLLRGQADLSSLTLPLVAGKNDRLVLLKDEKGGRWPERERRLQYLLIPGDNGTGELQLHLDWFDPDSGNYVETGPAAGSVKAVATRVIPTLLVLFGLFWLAGRWRRYRLLDNQLRQAQRSCPEQQLLARLRQAGAPEPLLAELEEFWRCRHYRFSRQMQGLKPQPPLPTKLVWKLSTRIDKRALHQP